MQNVSVMIRVMDYREFKRQLGKAGLSGRAFARLLGMNVNTISNYKGFGRVPDHIALIASFLADYAERGQDYMPIVSGIGISGHREKGSDPAAD